MCVPPPGQAWCLCRHDLELAKVALDILRKRLGMPPLLTCGPTVVYIDDGRAL